MDLAPHLSDLSEKHAGQVAIIGINNEGMLGRHPAMIDIEGVKKFIETKKENFCYSTYIDNVDEHARDRKLHISCCFLFTESVLFCIFRFLNNIFSFDLSFSRDLQ